MFCYFFPLQRERDSLFNSFTTIANASGLTPLSIRSTHISKASLEISVFNNKDIS